MNENKDLQKLVPFLHEDQCQAYMNENGINNQNSTFLDNYLEVNKQLRLGLVGVKRRDKYLFKYTKEKIWAQSGEWIRSWLASVHIARNQMGQAKEELNLSRGNLTYIRKRPERHEIKLMERDRHERKNKRK